jgi:23S rRNA (adenine2503-C2)-methyltransferase
MMECHKFFDQTRPELEALFSSQGISTIHAKSLFRFAYKKNELLPWKIPGFPKKLTDNFSNFDLMAPVAIASEHYSSYDGSVKFILQLKDGLKVEMVLMPEKKRLTLCVSSQVGCAQGCVFCHTGRMGLLRNLTPSEIVGQIWLANKWITEHASWLVKNRLPLFQRVSNVVFMGMGEPLDNVDAVAQSISVLTDPYGPAIALRRISVSTAGHLEGLDRLLEIHPEVRLAISVHSADSAERSRIMPINKRWPLEDLIAKLKNLPAQQEHGLLLQYTLIRGVNDTSAHARKLINLVKGMNVKINLIPLNPIDPSRLKSSDQSDVEAFRDIIYKEGIRVLIRYSKGQDIAAACGQLVSEQNSNV